MGNEKPIRLAKPLTGERELDAVREVLESGYLTEGPVTKRFEEEFARYVGTKHAVAVPNCTIALELSLRALGIEPGDEVVVPDFTYPATAEAVMIIGAEPRLVDVDLGSRNITKQTIEHAIRSNTKAIMPVSWGGNPLSQEIYDLAKERNIPVIEDSACSLGSELNGKKVGSLAELSCFSLHPRKVITTGEGGMITTNDDTLYDKMYSFKHFGMKQGVFATLGSNYKFSNILGAIGLVQLERLEGIVNGRIEKATKYTQLLNEKDYLTTPVVEEGVRHNFQSYTVLLRDPEIRDDIIKYLKSQEIESQIGTYALHLQPAFKSLRSVGTLQNSRNLFENLLALPLNHELTIEDQERVVDALDSYFTS